MVAARIFISRARRKKARRAGNWAGANLTTNRASPDRVRMPGPRVRKAKKP